MNTQSKTILLQEYFENASILANLKASYFSFASLDDQIAQIAQIERQMRSVRKMRKLSRSARSSGARRGAEMCTC